MYYIGSAVKRIADVYNQINSATLTGAIDILVIKQEDGTFLGSPFHVRFGKLGVLSSREKVVEISINDVEVELQMKLGPAGEAFFVERASVKESIPEYEEVKESDEDALSADDFQSSVVTRTTSLPIAIDKAKLNDGKRDSKQKNYNSGQNLPVPTNTLSRVREIQSDYPLSDMDSPLSSPLSGSPADHEPVRQTFSDTEIDISVPRKVTNPDMTWEWGMLPEGTSPQRSPRDENPFAKRKMENQSKSKRDASRKRIPSEGLLLDEVLAADKEVADLYFNSNNSVEEVDANFARESTPVGPSSSNEATTATNSNGSLVSNGPIIISSSSNEQMNGDENLKDDTLPLSDDGEPLDVSMSLCGELKNRRVEPEKFYEFLVTFEIFYANPDILHDPNLVIKINDRYYNWLVASPYLMSYMMYQRPLPPNCLKKLKQKHMPRKRRGWFSWRAPQEEMESSDEEKKGSDEIDSNIRLARPTEENITEFKKSLRLTSSQWKSLNLEYGANKITFTVTTRYQGTASCDARIFLWDSTEKIVISDIDGTITRSDVLGQLLPAVGKDWSQSDVTGLFSNIENNKYRFMYLSARAIGQAQITRDFLKSVKQGELTLPDGPVFLTPTSLLSAFRKEVIERKPEEFKISCMRDIQSLFPSDSSPFYSGFGNKINDVWAYRAVGIPISRIFTINYKGEIKHELTNAFSSSYGKLIDLVDQMFPHVNSWKTTDSSRSDFTYFSYWKAPIPDLKTIEGDEEEFEFP